MLVWSRVFLTMPVLDDVLAPGLRVVFCGTAPGRASAARGAYYAHPQNKFWRVLHEVAFTIRQLRPEEFREVLQYGLGLTDIAKLTFGMDSQLPAGSLGPEATRALRACSELGLRIRQPLGVTPRIQNTPEVLTQRPNGPNGPASWGNVRPLADHGCRTSRR